MSFMELLRKGPFFLDGGFGTLLQKKGLKPGEAPESWNLTHPEEVAAIHRAYFEAGTNMVACNTFGVHPERYSLEACEAMIRAAVDCARKAREEAEAGQEKFIALDVGPCGKLLKPLGPLEFEDAVKGFAEVVRIGAACGVDCIFLETMNDGAETRAALLAAKENCSLPVLVSNAYGADGKLMTGGSPESVAAMLEGLGADAVGVNCSLGPDALAPIVERYLEAASVPVLMKPNAGLPQEKDGKTFYNVGPDALAPIVERYLEAASVPVLMKPNAGLPQEKDGKTFYNVGPEEFSREIAALVPKGLRIMGGCCGTTPKALEEGDMAYVLNEAIAQEERGAEVLDVNVGTPGVDEAALLAQVVQELQAVTDLPLQLDTADAAAMERALRAYNGKAMINSVNGKQEVMDAVFPLVKKYGGVLVALTLDEEGIPSTAEGRVAIAERILKEAEKYGIRRQDILFDTLTMTVSADGTAAQVTLDALKMIRERTGCGTVLGVSNVSFGLPEREVLGSVFLTMALERGLSGAIMNPLNDRMLGAMISYRTLTGRDENCGAYIRYAGELPAMQAVSAAPAAAGAAKETDAKGLRRAVVKGLCREAGKLALAALENGRDGMELVQREIIPALDEVGQGFEAKRIFLPQLMMSAEAAEAAFREIKAKTGGQAGEQASKGTVVIATVKGDIHDIGKNIVRLLLENYGFAVTDLGKDVAPETVLEAVERLHAPVCGLSALMTTTVPAMAETVALLHEKAPWCRVMVGGAVLTEEYAKEIGADGYGRDAMAAVRLAESFMRNEA